jgi:hypothetical protein
LPRAAAVVVNVKGGQRSLSDGKKILCEGVFFVLIHNQQVPVPTENMRVEQNNTDRLFLTIEDLLLQIMHSLFIKLHHTILRPPSSSFIHEAK